MEDNTFPSTPPPDRIFGLGDFRIICYWKDKGWFVYTTFPEPAGWRKIEEPLFGVLGDAYLAATNPRKAAP